MFDTMLMHYGNYHSHESCLAHAPHFRQIPIYTTIIEGFLIRKAGKDK